jgi:hypothetical protein
MFRFSLLALPLMTACSSSVKLSAPEARHTFESLNRVSTSLVMQSLDSLFNGGSASLVLDTSSADYTLSGTLDEDAWSGDIDVDGSVERRSNAYGYNLALSFANVEMDDGAVFNGDLAFDFTADDSIDLSNLKYSAGLGVLGDLDVSGADRGRADVDYDVTLDLAGPVVTVDGKGTISGHDVSSWGEVLNLLF